MLLLKQFPQVVLIVESGVAIVNVKSSVLKPRDELSRFTTMSLYTSQWNFMVPSWLAMWPHQWVAHWSDQRIEVMHVVGSASAWIYADVVPFRQMVALIENRQL